MEHSPRHSQILTFLAEREAVSIRDLAQLLGVSTETVRRDIRLLDSRGDILRMHGAVALRPSVGEAPWERRMRENTEAKQAIAATVAATIRNGDSIMLDTGTTTSFLARKLLDHRRLTVVTNSSDVARTLAKVDSNHVHLAGGELFSDSGATFGVTALEFVSRFQVDHAIISAGAVHAEAGIMDYALPEAEFAQAVLRRGARRLVITDHSKFGRWRLAQVCDFSKIAELATDLAPPPEIADALAAAGTQLLLAK